MRLKIIVFTLGVFISCVLNGDAQGTSFTYQGRLNDTNGPATGLYDLAFTLYDSASSGNAVGAGAVTNTTTPVTNGLFTVTLDFGTGVFDGNARWLEIGVQPANGTNFATLSPRQALTATPYAQFSGRAATAMIAASANAVPGANIQGQVPLGSLPPSVLTNGSAFAGDGTGVTNVNATTLNGQSAANFWQLGGNGSAPGQFLGTTNTQAMEVWAGNQRALRLEPTYASAPNVIAGASVNYVAGGVAGATIAGGGATNYYGGRYTNSVTADFGVVGGGWNNAARGMQSTIGGGYNNAANQAYGTIAGGGLNTANGMFGTIGGGYNNAVSNQMTVVAGGQNNLAGGMYATVSGGNGGQATNSYATVPGGFNNVAGGQNTFAAGHMARATNDGSFVWADNSTSMPFNSISNNEFAVRAAGGVRLVTGGAGLSVDGYPVITNNSSASGSIALGQGVLATNLFATAMGYNTTAGGYGSIALGRNAIASEYGSTALGYNTTASGYGSSALGYWSTASGINSSAIGNSTTASGTASAAMGYLTTASGYYSTALGNSTLASGDDSTALGNGTTASGYASTALGWLSTASGEKSTALGCQTQATNSCAMAMGTNTLAGGFASTAAGGNTIASGNYSTALGYETLAADKYSTAMGYQTTATNWASTAMGYGTLASGFASTALGSYTTASGGASTAMGHHSQATGNCATAMGTNTLAFGIAATAMGANTIANRDYSTALGDSTTASGNTSVAMGYSTTASGFASTALGEDTTASGRDSTALGDGTTASGYYSTAMGISTTASGYYSTAMGYFASATNNGTFVWSDGPATHGGPFTSTSTNQFLVKATGGVGININDPAGAALRVNGDVRADGNVIISQYPGNLFIGGTNEAWSVIKAQYQYLTINQGGWDNVVIPTGQVGIGTTNPTHQFQVVNAYCDGNTWSPSSDRNLKAGFAAVSAGEILAKVAALPISSWFYTNNAAATHIGPMAQDFHAAFGLNGSDDKHIADVDEGGVALAAIQGLNQKLEQKDAKISVLEKRLAELEQTVQSLAKKK